MDRYRVKRYDDMYYVIDTKNDFKLSSSGYYQEQTAQIVCDKKNMQEDLSKIITV